MTKEQIIAAAQRKDAVLQASIDFIAALTGMKPPPIEIAPPETFQPFRDFTERVCQIFDNTSHTADGLTTKTEAPASQATKDVLAERQRQISVEGWTPEHDDDHVHGQMAGAASCYARHINARSWVVIDLDDGPEVYRNEPAPNYWPWDESWWKPTTPRRDAVKACALLLAEIERIDRAINPKEAAK